MESDEAELMTIDELERLIKTLDEDSSAKQETYVTKAFEFAALSEQKTHVCLRGLKVQCIKVYFTCRLCWLRCYTV